MRVTRGRATAVLLAGSLSVPSLCAAAEQKPLWELGFAFAALSAPDYRGSDETRGYLLPLPYIVYRGDILRVERGGIYSRLIDTDRIKLDLSGDAGVPVDSSKNRARAGMPDLDPVFEVGPSLEICLWRSCAGDRLFQFRLPVRFMFSTNFTSVESRGGLVHPHLNLDWKNVGPGGGWNVGIAGGPIYATERYHDYYYEVQPVFATAARPAFDARGGYSGSRVTFAFSKRFRNVWVGAFARADSLAGARFEDSPLVRRTSWFMTGVSVAWVFAESDTMVDVRD